MSADLEGLRRRGRAVTKGRNRDDQVHLRERLAEVVGDEPCVILDTGIKAYAKPA